MNVFWAFAILLIFILIFVIVIRHRFLAWGWNFALIAFVLYAGLFKMTGSPRDAYMFSTIEQVHGDIGVLWQTSMPHKFIYLLVAKDHINAPYYLQVPWSKELDKQLKQATMEAQQTQSELRANADELSKWLVEMKADGKGKASDNVSDSTKKAGSISNSKSNNQYEDKDYKPKVFYPSPVQPDALKNYRITIEGTPEGPLPDARTLLEPSQ